MNQLDNTAGPGIDIKSFDSIRKDTINYFANKLRTKFSFLKKVIYCNFVVLTLDYLLMGLFPLIFSNMINIISITILFITINYALYVFKHSFAVVSYQIYRQTIKVIITLIISLVIYYADMFYILLYKILYEFAKYFPLFEKTFLEIFLTIFLFFAYLILNLLFPVIILFKLFQVRDSVKDVGKAQGEYYDSVSTQEIEA